MRALSRWRLRAVAAGAAAALMVPGLVGGSTAGASGGQSLTLYSGQHQQTTQALVTAFEKQTGIKVSVRYDDEDVLAQQIASEGKRSPADVFFTEDSPSLQYLQGRGLLAKVRASTLAKTPTQYDSSKGDWVAVSARASVLIYDPSLITKSTLPTTVLQMADPRYAGKLAIAPGETDFQPVVTAVLQADGRAKTLSWLQGIKSNAGSHNYPDNETIADEVNRGEVAFGLVNQYYFYRMRAEIGQSNIHSAIAYFAPQNPGYVVDVSGAAIPKSAPDKAAAQRFLAFLVSAKGQEIIATPSKSISFEYPIDSTVTTNAPETPFATLQPYPITITQLGSGSTAVALLKQAGLL